MITEQPLPQHPGPPWPLQPVSRSLDAIVADIRDANDHAVQTITKVRADADEKIHALKVTAARLAKERDRLDGENSALVAAAFVLVADNIRREEALETRVAAAANKAEAQARIINGLEGLLDDNLTESRRLWTHLQRLIGENERLRSELDDAVTRLDAVGRRRGFRRKH